MTILSTAALVVVAGALGWLALSIAALGALGRTAARDEAHGLAPEPSGSNPPVGVSGKHVVAH